MSDEQIISILQNTDWFALTSPVNYIFRFLGWKLLTLLANVSNAVEGIVNEIYSLNGFFHSEQINSFIDEMMPLIWVILAISLAFLGMKIIFDREFKVNSLIKNFALAVSIVVLLPMGMDHLEKMTSAATEGLKTEYKLSANKVLKDNLYDLYYLDSRNFSKSSIKNNIPESKILDNTIDINEEIDTNEVENKDVFSSKLATDESGKTSKQELKSIFFGLFSENYYRFNFKFFGPFITLFCTALTLLISSIKVARIIFELGFVKLFGLLYSFADITTGQKTKEIIRCIVSNFIILFIISVLLKMYLMFSTWSSEQSDGITQIILLIGASLAVIDGPNIVERVLGIDTGVKSGWSVIAAGYTGAKGAAELISSSKVVGKITATGGRFSDMTSGLKGDKKGSLEEQMSQNKDSNNALKDKNEKNIHDQINAQKAQNSSVKDDNNIKADANGELKDNVKAEGNLDENINGSNIKDSKPDDRIGVEPIDSAMNNDSNIGNDMPPKLDSEMNGNSINDISSMNKDSVPPLEEAMKKETPTSSGAEKLESSMNKINDSPTIDNRARESSVDHQINSGQSDFNNNTANSTNNTSPGYDNRTFAGYVSDKMRSHPTIQSMHKSYTIGKNTGHSLSNKRKSIMNKKNRKNK